MMVEFTLNGARKTADVPSGMPLLWVLRDTLAMTGTKFGCGLSECGACTVHVDGRAVKSCSISIDDVAGKRVTTIEGLSSDRSHPVQRAWMEEDVPQCGYCQSGQIMAAASLLAKTPRPTDAEIDQAMRGNICRCGTYENIRRAIHRAAGTPALASTATASGPGALIGIAALVGAAVSQQTAADAHGTFDAGHAETEAGGERLQAPRISLDRRDFLRLGAVATGGLLIGFVLPGRAEAIETTAAEAAVLNAWIHIGADDAVTLFIHKAEMGQGTVTSLSMLLAEELECDWSNVRTEFPGIDRAYGPSQGVYGSQSIRTSWMPLRQAGATARQMLIDAAAAKWGVPASACRAERGSVVNTATNARLTYGALADAAASRPVPATPTLKDPSQFRLIGTPVKRLDTPSKIDGSATFGIDVRLPGMLYAVVARCPVFGGKVATVKDAQAKLVPGVRHVVQISSGVAVVADNTWAAMEGRRALDITWNEGPTANVSSESLTRMFAELVATPGAEARKVGDAPGALTTTARKIDAVYDVPFLAHAPMEPLNCTADVKPDRCDVWASTQGQTAARQVAASVTGLAPEKVFVHTLYMGGGFGRRTASDYMGESVEISKAVGVPVKLTWSRIDDTKHDRYRPASYIQFKGGVDADGWPVAWTARIACPAFSGPRPGVDRAAVEGAADLAYAIPNILVEYHNPDTGIPTHYWRSVGYSQNTFFTECFLDELAALGGKDPLDVRRRLLQAQPRMLAALELAASKAGWGTAPPAGRARGLSVVNNIGSFTAQVAEVSMSAGTVRVHRVVCAVDCGHVVNPAIVRQQIASGIIYGLSAALKGAITIDRGRVQEASFSDYDVIRMPEAPVVEVHIVPSTQAPGGIGEASVPGIAPAVANAVFKLTGKRVRRLPMQTDALA